MAARALCLWGITAVLLLSCSGDRGGSTRGTIDPACGLPSPGPVANAKGLPEAFLLGGDAQLTSVQRRREGLTAVLNVPLSVGEALALYTRASRDAGFKILSRENEGFEAEVYLRRGRNLGAVQIRTSLCSDASIVFVSIVESQAFAPPSPLGSPSPSAR